MTFAAAKGKLPRLRFGMPYRFRSRLRRPRVQQSVGRRSVARQRCAGHESRDVLALRGSVDPPALVHRARTSEGESLERMVIRSNWNVDTAVAYLLTPKFAAARALPASADFEYTADNERHVVPPKSSQLQCEQHGLFDPLFGDPANIKLAYELRRARVRNALRRGAVNQIELVTPALARRRRDDGERAAQAPRRPTIRRVIALLPDNTSSTGRRWSTRRTCPTAPPAGFALRAMPGHSLPGVTGPMTLGPSAAVVLHAGRRSLFSS